MGSNIRSVRIDEDLWKRSKTLAAMRGTTVSEMIVDALRNEANSQPKRNELKVKARQAVAAALKTGLLVKSERCQRCGENHPLEGHHHLGYEEEHWLDVRWLCKPCHSIEDTAQRRAIRDTAELPPRSRKQGKIKAEVYRMALIHVRVKPVLRDRIEKEADELGVTASTVVRTILNNHFETVLHELCDNGVKSFTP